MNTVRQMIGSTKGGHPVYMRRKRPMFFPQFRHSVDLDENDETGGWHFMLPVNEDYGFDTIEACESWISEHEAMGLQCGATGVWRVKEVMV